MDYRYRRYTREARDAETSFDAGKDPGWSAPDFDLPTTAGARVRKSDYAGERPLLVITACITDPIAASAAPVLRRLHAEFGDQVAFLTVYVRETHPGDHIRQPATFDWKMRHARMYRVRDGIPWTVAVDDLDGTLHRALGGPSGAAFVIDPAGNVAFRTLHANDGKVLREALLAVAAGESGHPWARDRRLVPALRGLGHADDVVRAAGPQALDDFRREAPLSFLAGEVAWVFRTLTPLGRALVAAAGAAALLGVLASVRLAARARA